MVVGGFQNNVNINNVEIIDLASSSTVCQPVQNYPLAIRGVSGGLVDNQTPLVCGGLDPVTANCYTYQKPNWVPAASMTTARFHFGIQPITSFQGTKAYMFATGSASQTYSEVYDGSVWYKANLTGTKFINNLFWKISY